MRTIRRISPIFKKLGKKSLIGLITLILVILPTALLVLFNSAKPVSAAWADEEWGYRKSIAITAHTSSENNVYISTTISNTNTLVTNGQLQSDCGDLRFTKQNGEVLPYYISSGCNSASTVVQVFFNTFPAGAQTIYFYYGNPSATNGFRASAFSTEATSYTIGSTGSEEKAPSPVAYWKFDDGTGTTAQDSTTNNNDGTLSGSIWQTEDMCVSGKCLKFDGTDDRVSVANSDSTNITGNITVSAWVKVNSFPSSGNHSYIVAKGYNGVNESYFLRFYNSGGTPQLNFGSFNGSNHMATWNHDLSTNRWYFVSGSWDGSTWRVYVDGVLKASASDATGPQSTSRLVSIGAMDFNGSFSRFLNGFIDEPKIYNYARSADQIKADYNSRANSEGAASRMDSGSGPGMTLSNGLVGYWKMDESSWTNNCTATSVTDSSGNSNNGKACPNSTGPTGGASGKFGNAGSFDGSDDYVNIANSTNLNITSDITLSAWVNVTSAPGEWNYILSKGNGTQYSLIYHNSGRIYMYAVINGGWREVVNSSTTITTGTWYHVAATYSPTTQQGKAYINGSLTNTNTLSGLASYTIANTTDAVNIGATTAPNQYFSGKLDEARVYNRALSPSEVTQLYNFAPGPVAYYNFEENTGTTVNDRSGNGNTGTWNGSGSPKWKPGKYGAAGNFDGSTDYVNMSNSSTVHLATTFTLSAWVKSSSLSSTHFILGDDDGGSNRSYVWGTNGSKPFFSAIGISDYISNNASSATLTTGQWYHMVLTYDGTNYREYVNGTLGATVAGSRPNTSSGAVQIGVRSAGTLDSYWNGNLDDVKIYNYARTQDQIISDMQGNSGTAAFSLSSSGLTAGSNTKPAAPVGYWRFDEGYGTTANNVGNGGSALNGTLTNMASPATSTSGWTQSGKVNKALVFDGTNDYVTIAANSIFNFRTNSFSYGAWAKATSLPSGGSTATIFDRGTSTNPVLTLYINNIGQVTCGLRGANQNFITATSTQTISANTWYHFMCVRDINSGNLYTYVNGVQWASSSDTTGALDLSSFYLEIGGSNGTSSIWIGQIDEAKLYLYALTADQIKMDMNQGAAQVLGALGDNSTYAAGAANQEYCVPGDTATCSAPVGRWDFDEATGTTANDSSGNANTGTLTNGPTWKAGKVNKSLNFDGTDDYVDAGNASSVQLTTGTVEAWVKSSGGNTSTKGIVVKGNAWGLFFYNDTLAAYNWGNSTVLQTGVNIADNSWHHVAMSFESGVTNGTKIYLDGVLKLTTTLTVSNQSTSLQIGANTAAQFSNAQIDQVRIFNYARSAAQVAWDYNKGAPVGHWRMDECQGTTVNDGSGNSNTGTITIGASGTQTSAGTCTDGSSTSAWYNGRTGKRNYSLNFDGTDDYIEVPHSNTNDLKNSTGIALSAWVKTSSSAANQGIIGKWDGSQGGRQYSLGIATANSVNYAAMHVSSNGTSRASRRGDTVLTTGQWYHIVGIWKNDATLQIFVNGIPQTLTDVSSDIAIPTSLYNGSSRNVCIGIVNNTNANDCVTNTQAMNGQLDDVRVYNYALTPLQVKMLHNEGAYRSGPSTGAP